MRTAKLYPSAGGLKRGDGRSDLPRTALYPVKHVHNKCRPRSSLLFWLYEKLSPRTRVNLHGYHHKRFHNSDDEMQAT